MKAHRITPPIPAITLALIAAASPADFYSVDDDDPAADFDTIQAAVDVAVDGDTIFVGPGEYFDPGPLGRAWSRSSTRRFNSSRCPTIRASP